MLVKMKFTLTIYGSILFFIIGILLIIFHAEIAKFLDNSLGKYTEDKIKIDNPKYK